MIWFHQVCKEFHKSIPVLQSVDLHVRRGEFVFLTGGSGAGKSTLLNLVLGAESPSRGEVIVGGLKLSTLRAPEWPYFHSIGRS